ncbi:MAG: hypothetical protein IJZ68_09225 [Bacteroidaceae bacterium]|nr:hypothetical protein [Bacteroidaceae bacterium]
MTVTFISNDHTTAQSMQNAVKTEPWKKTQRVFFKRGMCEIPRIGESILVNDRRYRVVDIIHEVSKDDCCTEHKACYAYLEVRGLE